MPSYFSLAAKIVNKIDMAHKKAENSLKTWKYEMKCLTLSPKDVLHGE